MKTLVTHQSLDLDAICACWLIVRFLPEWQEPHFEFVPAGSTFENSAPDENPNILHVDTGLGRFDHHQTAEHTCASKLVLEYLTKNDFIPAKRTAPLERIIDMVNSLDHFQEVYFPDADADRYDFMLHQTIEGLKPVLKTDEQIIRHIFSSLDAILNIMGSKIKAEEEIRKGFVFNCSYGRCLALESRNEEAVKLAQKKGYNLVVKKDPERGFARIKTIPDPKLDLTPVYRKILKIDKKGTWFLHVSGHMLLNSSSKNPNFIPTTLTLQKLIEIIRGI